MALRFASSKPGSDLGHHLLAELGRRPMRAAARSSMPGRVRAVRLARIPAKIVKPAVQRARVRVVARLHALWTRAHEACEDEGRDLKVSLCGAIAKRYPFSAVARFWSQPTPRHLAFAGFAVSRSARPYRTVVANAVVGISWDDAEFGHCVFSLPLSPPRPSGDRGIRTPSLKTLCRHLLSWLHAPASR